MHVHTHTHTNMYAHTCVYMHTHLQVTEKLMEAEEKKLRVLKAEIEASKHSDMAGDTEKVHTTHTSLILRLLFRTRNPGNEATQHAHTSTQE